MSSLATALRIARKHRDAGGPLEIGTRLITSKKAQPTAEPTDVSMQAMRDSPPGKTGQSMFAKNVGLLRSAPGMDHLGHLSDEDFAEHFINHAKNNLLYLHDKMAPELRGRAQNWYDGANRIAQNWAKQYGIPVQSAAAALAALSPQKDWFQNVSMAHRVLHTLKGQGENFRNGFTFSPEMHDKLYGNEEKGIKGIEALNSPELAPLHQHIFGKSYNDLNNLTGPDGKPLSDESKLTAKAMWVRLYDEAHNSPNYHIITPEGDFGDIATNNPKKGKKGQPDQPGEPSKAAWGSLNEIGKAIAAVEGGGDMEHISRLMGGAHKVRNFYNNIINPNSKRGHTTIDTHAVAAALLRPLSGKSIEVTHNFGNYPDKKTADALKAKYGSVPTAAGSAVSGIQGTYPVYHEAYRRAAAERGILPRQMQSITWEAIRSLFPDTFKTPANNSHIDKLWTEHAQGLRNADDTRNAIHDFAGGIRAPDWSGRSPDADAGVGHPGVGGELPQNSVHGGQEAPARTFRRGGGVSAPRDQGNDAGLKAALRIARAHGGGLHKPKHVRLHVGPIHSHVAGRTDHLPNHVPSNSYVLPADIVSGMGEGNTISGFRQVRRMFGGTPYGGDGGPYGQSGGPYLVGKAEGGSMGHNGGPPMGGDPVPVVLAGGEHVLTPEEVQFAGMGDVEAGHKALDDFVKQYREKTIKTLAGLPGPRRD